MRYFSHNVTLGLGLTLALTVSAGRIGAQSCTLEYRRADNMWPGWGSLSGALGAETITLQPGQKKVFSTEWSYEKQRNDGTNYYGSHLRYAVNRGTSKVHIRLRGPMLVLIKPANITDASSILKVSVDDVIHYVTAVALPALLGGPHFLQPGDMALYRHDLAEVTCPGTVTIATAPPPAPPAQPVLLSLTGTTATATSTTITVTVQAQDAKTGASLTGQVTIGGVTGTIGQPITYTRCTETIEFEDTRGVTRTRTVRAPCEGTVKISGYADTFFTF